MLGWGRVCVVGVCRCNRLSASTLWPHVITRVNLGSVVLQPKVRVWSLCVWWGGGFCQDACGLVCQNGNGAICGSERVCRHRECIPPIHPPSKGVTVQS
jgi:hypothetical protein